MYRKEESTPIPPENFELPFEGKLSSDNRWVIMADLIPWKEFESEYSSGFSPEMGAPAKSFRMALGALIIKEKLGISDRETVEQIRENPYLQYFLGMSLYSKEDEGIRNSIEGKFGEPARCGGSPRCSDWRTRKGQAKRRFGLDRVMAKLNHTSVTAIAITFLVMNLSTQMSQLLCTFLCLFFNIRLSIRSNIIDTYDLIVSR